MAGQETTHKFVILYINKKTKEVDMKATCRTKKMTLERAKEVAKKELKETQKRYKQYSICLDFL